MTEPTSLIAREFSPDPACGYLKSFRSTISRHANEPMGMAHAVYAVAAATTEVGYSDPPPAAATTESIVLV